MSLIYDIFRLYNYTKSADRIGPDLPFSHWKLYFRSVSQRYLKKKLYHIGENSSVRPGAYLVGCSNIYLGRNVVIRPHTMIFAETIIDLKPSVIIEDNVLIGAGVHFYVNDHKFDNTEIDIYYQGYNPDEKIILRKGAWIGANVTILKGVEIGENAVVAAGAVVTKSIPPRVVAGGVPARIIKKI